MRMNPRDERARERSESERKIIARETDRERKIESRESEREARIQRNRRGERAKRYRDTD